MAYEANVCDTKAIYGTMLTKDRPISLPAVLVVMRAGLTAHGPW